MLRDVTDLAKQRSSTEALGFYLFWSLVYGACWVLATNAFPDAVGIDAGIDRLAMIACPILAAAVVFKRDLATTWYLLALAAAPLAAAGGTTLGLIPAAYLTTLASYGVL